MVPTKERNHTGIFLSYDAEGILIDCGEGIQRQMKIAGIKLTKITKILITHWHGDHVLGLPGLLQSLAASEYNRKLYIFGPKGTKNYFKKLTELFILELSFEIIVEEVEKGFFFENEEYMLEAQALEHGMATVGYSFVEKDKRKINVEFVKKKGIPEGPLLGELQKGKSITFKGAKISVQEATHLVKGKKLAIILDTLLCDSCYKLAENADTLICESSYASNLENKAHEYKHLTAQQAALIASQSNVKQLVLTHFSTRYKNSQEIEEDARTYFNNIICAEDFMKIKV
jgi:ribonuclease Z